MEKRVTKKEVCEVLYQTVANYEEVKFSKVYRNSFWDGDNLRYYGHNDYTCPKSVIKK